MRKITEPPPSSQCDRCGGVLKFKRVDATNAFMNIKQNVFTCTTCGKDHMYSLPNDFYTQNHVETSRHP